MSFIEAKTALVTMLGNEAAGRYKVVGYQQASQAAETFSNLNRTVSVRFHKGKFDKGLNSSTEDFIQDDWFELILRVSKSSSADLSVLDNPNATALQREAVIEALEESADLVDTSMDEFYDILRNIIMTPANRDFQAEERTINDRWLDSFEKGETQVSGEYAILHGTITITCQTIEEVVSEAGVPLTAIGGNFTVTLDEDETDTYTQTELEEEYT